MNPTLIWIGALCALTAVAMGAFGAHALRDYLSLELMQVYQTAVNYHMWHALGLIGIGLYRPTTPSRGLSIAGGLMVLGLVLFSGSLYVLCLTGLRWLGMITPLGGLSFIVAWALFAWTVYQHR